MKLQELKIQAAVNNLSKVQQFVESRLEEVGCTLRDQMQIALAVEEIFVNIAHYAYGPESGEAQVRVETARDPARIIITFTDRGKPYDPVAREDPDVTLSAEKRKIGGLGIFLAKKTMDDVTYEYKDGQNILRLTKNLKGTLV